MYIHIYVHPGLTSFPPPWMYSCFTPRPSAAKHPTRMVWVTITATCAVTGHVYWMGKEQYVCCCPETSKDNKHIQSRRYIWCSIQVPMLCIWGIYRLYVYIFIVKQKNLTLGGKDSSGMMSNLSRECDQDATRYSNFWLRTNLSEGLKAEEWSFPNKWMMFPDVPLFMGVFHAVCPTPRAYHPKQKRELTWELQKEWSIIYMKGVQMTKLRSTKMCQLTTWFQHVPTSTGFPEG